MAAPLLARGRVIGMMAVWRTDTDAELFTDEDLNFLVGLSQQAAIAIETARLFQEIGRQKQYFESLVDISPVAVVTMDRDEVVSGWNPAAERLFGYSAQDAIGRTIDSLVIKSSEYADEGQAIVREALEQGRAHRLTRRMRADGKFVEVEVDIVPLVVDGDHQGYYGIYHDVSELQEARRSADAANEAKSAFLATMSHEIRTPMNAIIGMSGLLLGTELNDEQREYATTVSSSGEALLAIINDILDFSKIEAGKMDLEEAPFDVRGCIESAIELVGPSAAKKGIEVAYWIEPGTPEVAVGDVSRLRQILLNLLNNAVKFTEQGEVAVTVAVHAGRLGREARVRGDGPRHGDRDPARPDRSAVPLVQPGRRLDEPALRWDRPRPGDQPATRGADGRHGVGRERRRAGRGQHVPPDVRGRGHGHDADRAPPGRVVRRSPSRSSWTTTPRTCGS